MPRQERPAADIEPEGGELGVDFDVQIDLRVVLGQHLGDGRHVDLAVAQAQFSRARPSGVRMTR